MGESRWAGWRGRAGRTAADTDAIFHVASWNRILMVEFQIKQRSLEFFYLLPTDKVAGTKTTKIFKHAKLSLMVKIEP